MPAFYRACSAINRIARHILSSRDGASETIRVAERVLLFALAESLIEVPSAMTHACTASSPLAVSPDLIGFSVGSENPDDWLAALAQTLG